MAVKEKEIKGTRCRYYYNGNFWIAENGMVAAVDQEDKNGFTTFQVARVIPIKVDSNGEHYVSIKKYNYLLKDAVYTCFRGRFNDYLYEVDYKDGNKSNLHFANLVLKQRPYVPPTVNTANSTKLTNGISITKKGEVYQKNGTKEFISDNMHNDDIDCFVYIGPHCRLTGLKRISVEEMMDIAGYVHGDKRILKDPVILHRDNDPNNCESDNLEWVERNDQRYIDYEAARKIFRHNRNMELNPNKPLPPGF